MTKKIPPLRVLSLDGGGMRGAYTATYLGRIADAFSARRKGDKASLDVGAAFDLIVGTSTGGILACALAAGVPLEDVVDLYVVHGKEIFIRPLPKRILGVIPDHWLRPKALARGTEGLRHALTKKLGDKTLGQLYQERGIALAIPAVEMSQHRGWVFKTPHFEGTNHRDDGYSLVDICLATSAAPMYRSLARLAHSGPFGNGFNVFADGGLWANNPVMVALIEALEIALPGQEIQIFCLGTCPEPAGEQVTENGLDRRLADWKFGGAAASLSIDAQHFCFDHMAKKLARHVGRECTIIRFPSDKVPAAIIPYLGLDEVRPEAMQALISQARTDSDMLNSKCAYAEKDKEAALVCSLFDSTPILTNPAVSRKSLRDAAQKSGDEFKE